MPGGDCVVPGADRCSRRRGIDCRSPRSASDERVGTDDEEMSRLPRCGACGVPCGSPVRGRRSGTSSVSMSWKQSARITSGSSRTCSLAGPEKRRYFPETRIIGHTATGQLPAKATDWDVMVPVGSLPTKLCPQCAELVRAAAALCLYCRYEFGPLPAPGMSGGGALGSSAGFGGSGDGARAEVPFDSAQPQAEAAAEALDASDAPGLHEQADRTTRIRVDGASALRDEALSLLRLGQFAEAMGTADKAILLAKDGALREQASEIRRHAEARMGKSTGG